MINTKAIAGEYHSFESTKIFLHERNRSYHAKNISGICKINDACNLMLSDMILTRKLYLLILSTRLIIIKSLSWVTKYCKYATISRVSFNQHPISEGILELIDATLILEQHFIMYQLTSKYLIQLALNSDRVTSKIEETTHKKRF